VVVSGTQVEGRALAWVFRPCEGEELCAAKNRAQKVHFGRKKGRLTLFSSGNQ